MKVYHRQDKPDCLYAIHWSIIGFEGWEWPYLRIFLPLLSSVTANPPSSTAWCYLFIIFYISLNIVCPT